jgi:hypothetical protein
MTQPRTAVPRIRDRLCDRDIRDRLPAGSFRLESDMTAPAIQWMKSCGLSVKPEFNTPWGICDLVGIQFNTKHVAHRLHLKQTKPIGSVARALLLLEIPDIETRRSIALGQLVDRYQHTIPAKVIADEISTLVRCRFVVQNTRGRLQKLNGWMPLQDRLVAVELKISRVQEAMRQAKTNLGFADESYVGFPMKTANRILVGLRRWRSFFEAGIGMLGVAPEGCTVLVAPGKRPQPADTAVQFYCVEKFWRTLPKGN